MKKKPAAILFIMIGALAVMVLCMRSFGGSQSSPDTTAAPAEEQSVYTCSMHPQVRLPEPGSCPICQMPLIPASGSRSGEGQATVQLSAHGAAMAGVATAVVERRALGHLVRAVGSVEYNETALATITARVDGYAERLFVNFTGVEVKRGDHLAEIYSPELLVAEQELLIALQGGKQGPLIESATLKLKRWGLTDQQIKDLVERRKITDRVTLLSPIDGTVTARNITTNAAFKAGEALYQIANLDSVWVYLDLYENQLPWLRYGQHVDLTTPAHPGRRFHGMVTFIQPLVNQETRTVRVPVHIDNKDHALSPGMFMTAEIHARLGAEGEPAATGVEGRYTCPMHPHVLEDHEGSCPVCGMSLEQIPGASAPAAHDHTAYRCPMRCEGDKSYAEPGHCPVCGMALHPFTEEEEELLLAVPESAVLDSGTRQLVYVERGENRFEGVEVTLGPKAGSYYPVLAGLKEGERIAVRGNFLLDSQAQITGHSSLLYPRGEGSSEGGSSEAPHPGHAHHH